MKLKFTTRHNWRYSREAYAEDERGNGFSLTASPTRRFKAVLYSKTRITEDPTAADFAGAPWREYISKTDPTVLKVLYESNSDTNQFTDADKDKLDGLTQLFKGTFLTLAALEAEYPTGAAGWSADVDAVGEPVARYAWDTTEGAWILQKSVIPTTYESLTLNLPGVIDADSATAMITIAKAPVLWNMPDAEILEVKAIACVGVSTGTEPTIDVTIDSTPALASPLSVNEVLATATLGAAKTITEGQMLDISVVAGNGDAEDIVVYIKFKLV